MGRCDVTFSDPAKGRGEYGNRQKNIKTICDLGCGDCKAIESIYNNLDIEYIGYDTYAELINYLSDWFKGKHTINFNGSDLSSGIYIYTVRAGKFLKSKKMVLIK